MTDEKQQDQTAADSEGTASSPEQPLVLPHPFKQSMLNRSQYLAFKKIAERLGEQERYPRQQIMKIIVLRGIPFAQRKADEALKIDRDGGMLTKSGNRRRTPGGIFFHLVRDELTYLERHQIFPPLNWRKKLVNPNAPLPTPSPPRLPDFAYGDRFDTVRSLKNEGELNTFKVVMVGRPLSLTRSANYTVAEMVFQGKTPFFPRGVPYDIPFDTQYPVYMANKHWERVAEALDIDPEDKLIIEGTAGWSQELNRPAVYATNVTTRMLERARHQK